MRIIEIPEFFPISEDALRNYAKRTQKNLKSGTAGENSYYADFKAFLETIFPPKKGYFIQIESRIQDSSNKPDISVYYNGIVLFHIEAKLPKESLDNLISSEKNNRVHDQIYRYRQEGVQLLITNFLEIGLIDPSVPNSPSAEQHFRFKCKLLAQKGDQIKPDPEAEPRFKELLTYTCEDYLRTITNINRIIQPLADIAKDINAKTFELLKISETNAKKNTSLRKAADYLRRVRDDFEKSIFKEEVRDKDKLFADLLAQTLVYGAFSAWVKFCQKGNNSSDFIINNVGDNLPFGSFLRDLFLNLKNKVPHWEPLERMEKRFQRTEYTPLSQSESIITTFYSDFLAQYDPVTAKERGVIYTPHEIVEYMIHGIDFMLQRWLDKPGGIISTTEVLEKSNENTQNKRIDRLQILDPAAGTMAFATGLLHVAKEKFLDLHPESHTLAQSFFNEWVKNEFFGNTYAFEILMAPYVLGHIRTFLTMEELGLKLNAESHTLKSYLMNTLMTPPTQKNLDKWMFNNQDIGREIKEALKIRDRRDIFVVMGNPPYNLSSQNNCEWINTKIKDYKKGLKEKNQKILADDYVKFLRFAQWKIEEVGTGVVAMITNNRYFEGQMFSVMRKSLRSTFDHIYIVNFHGDMRKGESGNPFDIRVGVGIAFMVRVDNTPNKKAAVHYMDVPYPTRQEKFAVLAEGFQEDRFTILNETSKNYFVEMDTTLLDQYEKLPSIDTFFKKTPTSGIMAGREHLLIDTDENNLRDNLKAFFDKDLETLETLKIKVNDTKSWQRNKVYGKTSYSEVSSAITKMQYRGMDYRHLAYNRSIVEGHRMGYIDQISPDNPALTVTKSSRKKYYCTAFISTRPIEKCYMSITDTAYAFLLKYEGKSNILKPDLPYSTTDEELFYYLYGILHARTYREKYDEFLRRSYPRIPFTKERRLYQSMSDLGRELASNHLLEIKPNHNLLRVADVDPDLFIIKNYTYIPEEETLYFDYPKKVGKKSRKQAAKSGKNKSSSPKGISKAWIKGITPEMWDYQIGNIPQLEQFLKSRKYSSQRKWNSLQRGLKHEELLYFLTMCSGISKCLGIESEIDEIYRKIDA